MAADSADWAGNSRALASPAHWGAEAEQIDLSDSQVAVPLAGFLTAALASVACQGTDTAGGSAAPVAAAVRRFSRKILLYCKTGTYYKA
jgi:hypothetical protein